MFMFIDGQLLRDPKASFVLEGSVLDPEDLNSAQEEGWSPSHMGKKGEDSEDSLCGIWSFHRYF